MGVCLGTGVGMIAGACAGGLDIDNMELGAEIGIKAGALIGAGISSVDTAINAGIKRSEREVIVLNHKRNWKM